MSAELVTIGVVWWLLWVVVTAELAWGRGCNALGFALLALAAGPLATVVLLLAGRGPLAEAAYQLRVAAAREQLSAG